MGVNCITKWAIVVVSAIYAVINVINLFRKVTDDNEWSSDKIIAVLFVVLGLVLSCLALYGAFTENACLCYIALGFIVFLLVLAIWQLISCFISDNNKCDTGDYIMRSLFILLLVLLTACIWQFIQSIKK